MIAEFIAPSDNRWSAVLDVAPHDLYHQPAYVVACALHEGGVPLAFYAEAGSCKFLAPVILRQISSKFAGEKDCFDLVSPYGYSPPLIVPSDNSEQLLEFLSSFHSVCLARGIVTAFFRLHPLLSLPQEDLSKYGEVVRHGSTVYVDLTRSYDELWAQTRRGHRKSISQLLDAGFRAVMDDWRLFDDFLRVYHHTMDRVVADDYYTFSDEFFAALQPLYGSVLHLCAVRSPEDETASIGLYSSSGIIAEGFLSGTLKKYRSLSPNKLLHHHVRTWAKRTGNRVLHLGGGVGNREDSLFHYKAGFSDLRAEFCTYRMIIDQRRYATLTEKRENVGGKIPARTDYFPLYRLPF